MLYFLRNIKMDSSGFIKLESQDITYLRKDVWTQHEDVVIKSILGQDYGFNKCMLASISWFCKELFLQLNECPLANLDEKIVVSSNFSDLELQTLKGFFLLGSLPQYSHDLKNLFVALGLLVTPAQRPAQIHKTNYEHTKENKDVFVKMEPEDEDCGEYWPIEERMVEHGSKEDMDSDYEEKPKFKNGKPVRKAAAKSALLTKLSIPVVVKKVLDRAKSRDSVR